MKMALEALEGSIALTMPKIDLRKEAIAALREALAQPQPEPLTYYRHYDGGVQAWPDKNTIPLYTAP